MGTSLRRGSGWNGSTWRTVANTRKLRGVTGLTPDGHGGFWLTATDPASPTAGP